MKMQPNANPSLKSHQATPTAGEQGVVPGFHCKLSKREMCGKAELTYCTIAKSPGFRGDRVMLIVKCS